LELDIQNPHFSKYYTEPKLKGNELREEKPVPVNFLTVKKATTFMLRSLFKGKETESLKSIDNSTMKKHIKRIIKYAFSEHGIGAKKSLGYGLFNVKIVE